MGKKIIIEKTLTFSQCEFLSNILTGFSIHCKRKAKKSPNKPLGPVTSIRTLSSGNTALMYSEKTV